MIAKIILSILLGLVALIAIILSLKVTLTVKYDGDVKLFARVLFVRIKLYPRKKKKHKRSMSAKKAQKVKKKKAKCVSDTGKKKEKKPKKTPSEIIEIIQVVCMIVKEVVSNLSKYLRIKIAKIHIKIATDDAAHTAIAYGAVTQSINVLFPLLENVKNFSMPKRRDIDIRSDFTSEECEMDLCLRFSVRVWQAALIAIKVLIKFIKHSIKSLEKKERKERKNHGK